MNNTFIKYIKNKKTRISNNEKFVAIIGGSPSKGARSPVLWNRVYRKFHKKIKMYPLDVSKKNVKKLIFALSENKNFLGGSVTIPFKETISHILKKNLSREAKIIGAVNCLFRDKKKLKGTNTDGEGALVAFNNFKAPKKIKNISILGCGGAGKAVIAYFAKKFKKAKINVFTTNKKNNLFIKKIKARLCKWKELDKIIYDSNLIINCTSIGFGEKINSSPLDNTIIKKLRKNTIIYDVIYQPRMTKFLYYAKKNNLKYLNGLEMNLQQAAIGFLYVNKNFKNLDTIKKIMNKK